jgi:hypothetical protein
MRSITPIRITKLINAVIITIIIVMIAPALPGPSHNAHPLPFLLQDSKNAIER